MKLRGRPITALLVKSVAAGAALAAGVAWIEPAQAQQLDVKFSCSSEREQDRLQDGDRRLYADSAEMHLRGDAIESFRWESSLFRSTHGFDCSIDDDDGLQAEVLPNQQRGAQGWRVRLQDGREARTRRGYDADHGVNCSIRIVHDGDLLHIMPSCPALCGSRENFSALTVDLKTGQCSYEH
jgi:hypothetical protein